MKQILSTFKHLSKKAVFLISALLVAGLGIFIYSYFFSKEAGAAWFNESWLYRTPLTITHNAEVPHNKVKFDIDTATLITAGKMQADCGDSRFTDANGNLLKYYLDSANGACNDASTDYYVLIPKVLNGTTVTYHYYGNPSAPNGSEPAQFSESTLTPSGSYAAGSEAQGPGPVGYWKFDDGQGTNTQDSSSSGNDGTITGATWQTEDRCVSGKCLYFDGTDDIVSVTDNPALDMGTHDFTISAWIRHTPTLTASWDSAIVEKITATDGYRFTIRETEAGSSAGKLLLSLRTSSADTEITSNTALNDGKWHHVVAAADRDGNVTFYVDGKSDGGGSIAARSASLDNTGDLRIGLTNAYFKGNMDEIKIYPYLRSAAQIKTDYLAGKANASTHSGTSAVLGSQAQDWLSNGLVGYWKMDDAGIDAEGESSTDSSGNSNTGTLYGDNGVGDNGTGMNCTASGKFGSGCDLDGTDDYVSIGTSVNLPTGQAFTITAWVNKDSGSSTYPVGWYQGTNGLLLYDNGTARVATGGTNYTTTTTLNTTGSWNQIVMVFDGTNLKTYHNGVAKDSISASYTKEGTGALQIGALDYSSGQTGFFDGKIDEVRIYNRALSPKEVSDLYNWAPGPVGYWDFEEGGNIGIGSTAFDRSGNNSAGIWAGTGAKHTDTGKYGKAGKFNGSDDYVDLGTTSTLNPTNGIAVDTWVKLTSAPADGQTIVSRWYQTTANRTYWLGIVNVGGLKFRFSVNGNDYYIDGTTVPTINTWYHVTGTWNNTNGIKLYVNGVAEGSIAGSNPSTLNSNSSKTLVGAEKGGAEDALRGYFPGLIDNLRIYNYARSQKQIVSDMNAGHPAVGSPVGSAVGHWKFDEGYGQTANNSGNQGSTLNGTLGADSGSSTDDPSWTNSGKYGRALSFDGGDYVNVPNNAVLNTTGDMTLSAWIKMSDISDNRYIFNKDQWTDSTNNAGYSMAVLSSSSGLGGKIQIDFRDNSLNNLNSNGTVNDNNWHHIVATFQAGVAQKIYIDGKLDNSTTSVPSSLGTTTNPLNIGRQYRGADQYFSGTIDEPNVYNYALTADEVKLEYNHGSSLVLGTAGTNSSYEKGAANQEYCIPGDSTSCAAPVGRWDFEEGSGGSVNDTSGNANTGTWNGTGSHWASGKIGKAGKFNGTDDYVSLGTTQIIGGSNLANNFTISGWYKAGSDADGRVIFSQGNSGSSNTLFELVVNNNNTYTFNARNDANSLFQINSTGTTILNNNWHNIVVTRSGTSLLFYQDGKQLTSDTTFSPTGTFTLNKIAIGRREGSGTLFFSGSIDNIRLFDYTRSAAQVAYDYNRGAPVGHWKMDECQGTVAHDSTLNNNHGTITIGASGEDTLGTCTTSSTAWGSGATGKYNYSLNFDGTDDYIDIGNQTPFQFGTGDFSASFWMKANAWSGYTAPLSNSVYTSSWDGFHFEEEAGGGGCTTGGIRFEFPDNTRACWNSIINTGTWYHVVGVRRSGTATIYVNGVAGGSSSATTANVNVARDFLIGRNPDITYPRYFNGQIDDVRIYNYALTATQVKDIMNQGAVFFGPSTGSP